MINPKVKEPVCEAFHVMTEYFVKKLDYEETEGILLAYELHKATLQENYDLEKIMDDYRMHEEKRHSSEIPRGNEGQEVLPEENIFSVGEEEYEPVGDVETIREMGGWLSPWKKTAARLKKKRWGSWKDLILETDEHETEDTL